MNVVDKSSGDEYAATEFTQFKNETQNAILGSGQTLSGSTQVQLREAIMRNATAGQGCVASGTANAIVLTTRSPFSAGKPSVYQADATYSALITQVNTSAVTVNINGLGVIPVKKNAYVDELESGDIVAGLYDFVVKADLSEVELVAKKATFAGGATNQAPWVDFGTDTKTDNYPIILADAGKLIVLGVGTASDKTFTADIGIPLTDGFFVDTINKSNFRLIFNDGTDDDYYNIAGDETIIRHTYSSVKGNFNHSEV